MSHFKSQAGRPSLPPPALFFYHHVPKNLFLIWLSLISLPFSIAVVIASYVVSFIDSKPKRTPTYTAKTPKTILVTGVSMTKGLTIARLLCRYTPHRIIGADIEPTALSLSPGRFSRSLDKFYTLAAPDGEDTEPYVDALLSLLKNEQVDLWISCSSVVSAIEDGQVMRLASSVLGSKFHAVQFGEDVVERLHSKDAFIDYIKSLELPVPESHRCTSASEVHGILSSVREEEGKGKAKKRFLMKPMGVDDRARNSMMTLLPLKTPEDTSNHVATLRVSTENPYILQQFIDSPEYCTHALVVRGKVKAFVACPSSELLMHYKALSPASKLSRAMLEFTRRVAGDGGEDFSGHLSFDFLVEEKGDEVMLWPIECNPRAHTAVILFENVPEMAAAYLSVFEEDIGEKHVDKDPVAPKMPCYSYYWVGHDLVYFVLIPFMELLHGIRTYRDVQDEFRTFFNHLLYWRDGTFTVWDPLPWLALYHLYWPGQFLNAIINGVGWSRINVSTTKVFEL
ncbi:hypothetical protein B0J11DRAFT_520778 [Dendryphion nanum]|uniref:ATP-grasp domain-containing protein n=1 Tax=Dendryphion nanum TaxID=256645 RepID=A0A9P9E481_9PLEO|nr:hypothetical protein B0J11DRAFT_520778 [Dendryphion nanum]